jgi:hypothetical protein
MKTLAGAVVVLAGAVMIAGGVIAHATLHRYQPEGMGGHVMLAGFIVGAVGFALLGAGCVTDRNRPPTTPPIVNGERRS